MKPYFESAGATLYHGDCRAILPQLPPIDLLLSDVPYGINYVRASNTGKGKHSRRFQEAVTGDGEDFDPAHLLGYPQVILWGANHYAQRLPHGRWLVWDKLDGLESFDSFSDVEIAWHNQRGTDRIYRHLWKGICQASETQARRLHPTQKPVALMAWCIRQAKCPAVICDPYCGSGTTGMACLELGRHFIGVEIEERFCEITARRIEEWQKQRSLFEPELPEPVRQLSLFGES